MNEIDLRSKEIYIFGDFTTYAFKWHSHFLKKNYVNNKLTPSNVKSNNEFCTFFSLHQLIKVTTGMACNTTTIINHILASYSERVTQKGIIDAGLPDHQLIFCTRKFLKLKDTQTC